MPQDNKISRQRDLVLDKFKFALIFLVVFGHLIEPAIGRFQWLQSVYYYIYLFHIPMFAYVSGALSKNNIDNSLLRGIVAKLIIPYLVLQTVYSIFDNSINGRDILDISFFVPYWILWYLLSLIAWRLLLPLIDQFKFPIMLGIALGLLCGLAPYEYHFSFSRTFVFFPFFLIGHYKHSQIIGMINKSRSTQVAAIGIVAASIVLFLFDFIPNFIHVGWLYGSYSYPSLGVDWPEGMISRLALYALSLTLGLSLLTLAGSIPAFFARYGRDVLFIYIFHGFFVKGLVATGLYQMIDANYKAAGLLLLAAVVIPLLNSHPAKLIGQQLINPFGRPGHSGVTGLILSKKS